MLSSRILANNPSARILKATVFEDDASVSTAMRAGGRGGAFFSPGVARCLIEFFSAPKPTAPPRAFPELTEREVEILGLIAWGRSNQEIADGLSLSLKTVQNHVSNIFTKIQVADRTQAVIRAREAGLGLEDGST